jgi:hypothetical protein
MAMRRVANKLHDYSIEVSVAALERAVESDWTSVYPESEKQYAKSNNGKSHKLDDDPKDVLKHYCGSNASVVFEKCLQPALQISNGQPSSQIAEAVAKLYLFCVNKQKRPEFEKTPRVGDSDYNLYCIWRDLIPKPHSIVNRYVKWLADDRRITGVSDAVFTSNNKYFTWFLDILRKQITVDPFTGRSL